MCDTKSEGGRRCPKATPEYRREYRAGKRAEKRLAAAAVEGTQSVSAGQPVRDVNHHFLKVRSVLGITALKTAWAGVDDTYAATVASYEDDAAADFEKPAPGILELGRTFTFARAEDHPVSLLFHGSRDSSAQQTVTTTDGSDYEWGLGGTRWWNQALECSSLDDRERVGILRNNQHGDWMVYYAVKDEQGVWDLQGRVGKDLNHAARILTDDQRADIDLPVNPPIRPDGDTLYEMFPPRRDAVKAAWADVDPAYVEEVDAAVFLAAFGDKAAAWASLHDSKSGGVISAWVNDAGFNATPLEGERWARHQAGYTTGGHQVVVTDAAGNPVNWDPTTVSALWSDTDHTGWRPVAMVKPKTTTLERKTPRARTKFNNVGRENAYGITHNAATGEWAVYNTTDTSTSQDWEHGRDVATWETRAVVSTDINKAAAHLTVLQRQALGLPGNPDATPATGA